MVDEHNVMSIFYNPYTNRFTDDFGVILNDIYRLITPNQLLIFRKYKEIYVVPDTTNSFLVEMIYPELEEE